MHKNQAGQKPRGIKTHRHFYQTAPDMSFRPRTIEDLDTAPESFSLDSHRHLLFNVSTKCLDRAPAFADLL
ncbi:hypothetical protein HPP92_022470 [Vanilla planifolia]|uniref:Uncharacterized protein n=1 Tax=Vanilla planifolia TaxID=51239 RepID=A0A835Q0N0_VANPL|nr:hypothetical protein HPP92_022470 [Vanilla planifolia]